AAPDLKRATVERREARASGGMPPRFARAERLCASWRSIPLGSPRETERRKTNPGAATRRGSEETALFDIVNRKTRPPGGEAHRGRKALRTHGVRILWQNEPNADLAERTQCGAG